MAQTIVQPYPHWKSLLWIVVYCAGACIASTLAGAIFRGAGWLLAYGVSAIVPLVILVHGAWEAHRKRLRVIEIALWVATGGTLLLSLCGAGYALFALGAR